jgi:hypothetical protein
MHLWLGFVWKFHSNALLLRSCCPGRCYRTYRCKNYNATEPESGCRATLQFKVQGDMYEVIKVQPEHIPDCAARTRAREEAEALEGGDTKKRRGPRGSALYVSTETGHLLSVSFFACVFIVRL